MPTQCPVPTTPNTTIDTTVKSAFTFVLRRLARPQRGRKRCQGQSRSARFPLARWVLVATALALACAGLNAISLLAISASGQDGVDWENPAVFRVNKEAPRATLMPFPSAEGALNSQRLKSPWCQLLNGRWKFHYAGHPDERPVGFEKPGFAISGWLATVPAATADYADSSRTDQDRSRGVHCARPRNAIA